MMGTSHHLSSSQEYQKYKDYKILPVKNKIPKIPKGYNYTNKTKEELDLLFNNIEDYKSIGMIVGKDNNLIVLDIDLKKDKDKKPIEISNPNWDKYILENEEPITTRIITPSGGLHYYFSYDERFDNINSKLNIQGMNIDLKCNNGYIVSPPTEGYTFNMGQMYTIKRMSDELYNFLIKKEVKKHEFDKFLENSEILNLNNETIKEFLFILESFIDDYNVWLQTGIILKNSYSNGFELWNELSKKGSKYSNEEELKKKWESFKIGGKLKIGSLYYLVNSLDPIRYKEVIEKNKYNSHGINILLLNKFIGQREIILNYFKDSLYFIDTEFYYWNNDLKLYEIKEKSFIMNLCFEYLSTLLLNFQNEILTLLNIQGEDISKETNDKYKKDLQIINKELHKLNNHYCYQFVEFLSVKNKINKNNINNEISEEIPINDGKVLNLKTLEIRDRNKNDFYTFEIPYSFYNSNFLENSNEFIFINEIMNYDSKLVNVLQKILGYSLTKETGEQSLFIFYGDGANGKSTLIKYIREIFGNYSIMCNKEIFISKGKDNRGRATTELNCIKRKRLSIIEELGSKDKIDIERFKLLTGNELIKCRELYKKEEEISNYSKFIICTNELPNFGFKDSSITRRLQYIPFTQRFVDNPIKEGERKKKFITLNLDNLFSWIVIGANRYYKESLNDQILLETKKEGLDKDNIIQEFLDVCTTFNDPDKQSNEEIKAKDLYDRYLEWCNNTLKEVYSQTKFGNILKKEMQLLSKKKSTGLYYLNLKFKDMDFIS